MLLVCGGVRRAWAKRILQIEITWTIALCVRDLKAASDTNLNSESPHSDQRRYLETAILLGVSFVRVMGDLSLII